MFVFKNSYLKLLYNRCNRVYFGGKLPEDIVVGYGTTGQFRKHRVKKGTCAFTAYNPLAIVIHRGANKSMTYIQADLLHEMCHVSKPRAGHGEVFQKEMLRIAKLGAFANVW